MEASPRWTALSAGLCLELLAGSIYGFAAYSEQIKELLGGDQAKVNFVSSIGQFGMYVGVFGGIFYDRFGAEATAYLGGCVGCLGYALAYMASVGWLPANVATLGAFFFIAYHGLGYLDTAAISTSVKNFPGNKGAVIGLLKSLFGLSGSVIASVAVGFFGGSVSESGATVLLFLACLVLVLAVVPARFLTLDASRFGRDAQIRGREWCRLGAGYGLVLALAAHLSVVSPLLHSANVSRCHPPP